MLPSDNFVVRQNPADKNLKTKLLWFLYIKQSARRSRRGKKKLKEREQMGEREIERKKKKENKIGNVK